MSLMNNLATRSVCGEWKANGTMWIKNDVLDGQLTLEGSPEKGGNCTLENIDKCNFYKHFLWRI